jgi:hypothetical protein
MERKYKVEPGDVDGFARAVAARMQLSEYEPGRPEVRIGTVYFDTPDYYFAKKAVSNGDMSIKLRAKDYTYLVNGKIEASNFCWIEVKSRSGIATEKWRFPLSKKALPLLLAGGDIADAVEGSAQKFSCVRQARDNYRCFQSHVAGRTIRPSAIATYTRKVYESREWDLRLTMDSDVRYFRAPDNPYSCFRAILPERMGRPVGAESAIIIETKSPNGLPGWLWPLLRACSSAQEFSKFTASYMKLMLTKENLQD